MTERLKTILKVCGMAAIMVAIVMPPLCWILYQNYLKEPLDLGAEPIAFNVPQGSNLSMVANELSQMGVLKYPRLLVWHARWKDATLIQSGEYQLEAGLTPRYILEKFNSGDVRTYSSTFPEGIRFTDMRSQLEANSILLADTRGLTDAELIAMLGLEIDSLEGWFYPDTYVFSRNTKVSEILIQAHERVRDLLEKEWSQRDIGLPLESPYEALILASLVEKETGVGYERPMIAGVFVRRLQKGMKLQTDPTVIYAMGDEYDGNIRRSDLSIDSPYNTYKYKGLPPTPIALAGGDAIRAVMHPAEGEALYFVAKGDGSHYFSSTLAEHNAAVQEYQVKKRATNYRSAPPVNND